MEIVGEKDEIKDWYGNTIKADSIIVEGKKPDIDEEMYRLLIYDNHYLADISGNLFIYNDSCYILDKNDTATKMTMSKLMDDRIWYKRYYSPRLEEDVIERYYPTVTSSLQRETLTKLKSRKIIGESEWNPWDILVFRNTHHEYDEKIGWIPIPEGEASSLYDAPITRRLPFCYDPEATCPYVDELISEWVKPEDINTLWEWIGYCLWPDHRIKNFVILYGPGDSGKSTFAELLRAFLGRDNCSSVTLHNLSESRFKIAELRHKYANIASDISRDDVKNQSIIKSLTGNDMLTLEQKYKQPFQFINTTKMIFTCNKIPQVTDVDDAYIDRLLLIEFPNRFSKDKNVLAGITDEELAGMFNKAWGALCRLLDRGHFEEDELLNKKERYYEIINPVNKWVKDRCVVGSNYKITKSEAHRDYLEWAAANGEDKIPLKKFGKILENTNLPVYPSITTMEGIQQRVWMGIDIDNSKVAARLIPGLSNDSSDNFSTSGMRKKESSVHISQDDKKSLESLGV